METRQKRKRSSKLSLWMRRIIFRTVLLAVVLAGLGAGVYWAKNIIVSRQVQMVSAQSGSLQVPIAIQAWAANTERVINAPTAGNLDKLVPQGQRVANGGAIAKIISQSINSQGGGVEQILASPAAGLVSYHIDGLEGLLTPENLTQWDLNKFTQLSPAALGGNTLRSGQAACKIVDNLAPTYLFFKSPEPERNLAPEDRVTIAIDDQKVKGTVIKTAAAGPQAGVVVALDSFLTQSLSQRQLKLNLLENKPATGEIIPSGAIVLKQSNRGVYLVKDGVATWRQVQILAQESGNTCVKGLQPGDTVITTPQFAHEGEIIDGNL